MVNSCAFDFYINVDEAGNGAGPLVDATRIDSFSVKTPAGATWGYEIRDAEGFIIAASGASGQIEGENCVPIARRCSSFRIMFIHATPGRYEVRAQI